MKFDVLVIGSKPDSIMPSFLIKKIYTANGAAERAYLYQKKYYEADLTCIVGDLEFEKNINVRKRIIAASPSRIIVRGNKIHLPTVLKKSKIEYLNAISQQKLQANFFNGGRLVVIFSEFFRETKFFLKLKYFLKKTKKFDYMGVSTGFFAILKALEENPNSKILITGVGMSGGKQFYKSIRNETVDYTPRSKVDRFLVKRFKIKYKKNLYTTDLDLHKNSGIKLWS
jgi:hypothetical protein|tara:strand:- start:507 stop:1187 length:681 start_codon:yes stop_codon:yes gene_type:complete